MRIVLVHPNYHSGGAEIAGNWPPAWVAYLAGSLKAAGFSDVHFVDAMTNDLEDEVLKERLADLDPDSRTILDVGDDVSVQQFIAIYDLCQSLGFQSIAFSVRNPG